MFNAIFVIIGTVVGAGFASGKEIFTFFNMYGIWGLCGLFLSEIIIGLIIYRAFCIIINYKISSYSQFISSFFSKSNFVKNIMCNIINIFLLISFIVMVAGFSAYFSQEFGLPYFFGAIIISLLSFITFSRNINGIVKVNVFFIPCLILIVLLLGIRNSPCFTTSEYASLQSGLKWFTSSILYSSYNLIIVLPILVTLRAYIPTKKHAKIVAYGTTFFMLFMSVVLFFLLNHYFVEIQTLELPTIFIANKLGTFYKYACGLLILGAIFTTAISSGYAFLGNLNISNKKFYYLIAFMMCIVSIILSNIGFSHLLGLLYPILGLLRLNTNYIYC